MHPDEASQRHAAAAAVLADADSTQEQGERRDAQGERKDVRAPGTLNGGMDAAEMARLSHESRRRAQAPDTETLEAALRRAARRQLEIATGAVRDTTPAAQTAAAKAYADLMQRVQDLPESQAASAIERLDPLRREAVRLIVRLGDDYVRRVIDLGRETEQ